VPSFAVALLLAPEVFAQFTHELPGWKKGEKRWGLRYYEREVGPLRQAVVEWPAKWEDQEHALGRLAKWQIDGVMLATFGRRPATIELSQILIANPLREYRPNPVGDPKHPYVHGDLIEPRLAKRVLNDHDVLLPCQQSKQQEVRQTRFSEGTVMIGIRDGSDKFWAWAAENHPDDSDIAAVSSPRGLLELQPALVFVAPVQTDPNKRQLAALVLAKLMLGVLGDLRPLTEPSLSVSLAPIVATSNRWRSIALSAGLVLGGGGVALLAAKAMQDPEEEHESSEAIAAIEPTHESEPIDEPEPTPTPTEPEPTPEPAVTDVPTETVVQLQSELPTAPADTAELQVTIAASGFQPFVQVQIGGKTFNFEGLKADKEVIKLKIGQWYAVKYRTDTSKPYKSAGSVKIPGRRGVILDVKKTGEESAKASIR
jgi:hypothetical protein